MNRLLAVLFVLVLSFSAGCTRQAKTNRAVTQGRKYLEAGELEKAKITYLSVLRSDGANKDAIRGLAMVWSEQGAPVEALRFLLRAKELNPKDDEIQERLASTWLLLQQIAPARKEAQELLDRSPTREKALFTLIETTNTAEEQADLAARLGKLDPKQEITLLGNASLLAKKGDMPKAEGLLDEVLKKNPASSEAHAAKGALLAARKDLAGAAAEFKAASNSAAPRTLNRLVYSRFLIESGDTKQAEAALNELSAQTPDYIPLWLLRARLAASGGDTDNALKLLDTLFRLDQGNLDGRVLQGQLFLAKGEADKATDTFQRLAKTPYLANSAIPRLELARAYLRKGSVTPALTALQEAVKLQPDNPQAVLLLSELSLRKGDAKAAIETLKPFVEKQSNSLPAQLLLSQAYVAQGNLTEAVKHLREQVQNNPDVFEPQLYLGIVYLQQNKPDEAREALEAARKLAPKNLLSSYYLLSLELGKKDYDRALRRARSLIDEMPSAAGPQLLLGLVYLAKNDHGEAEKALRKCIELDPNLTRAYDLLVTLYVSTEQLDKARSELELVLARRPEHTGALLTLGMIHERLHNYDQAKDFYQKTLVANPNSPPALNNLAVLYSKDPQQLDKAYELASRARTLQPEDGSVADTLGWINYLRKDYQQAVAVLRESAGKLPGNGEVQYHLGMACYMAGQQDAAKDALTKASAAKEDFPGKSDIAGALAMLGSNTESGQQLASGDLEKALTLHPEDVVVRQALSERWVKEGSVAKAAELWETAMKQTPKLLAAPVNLAKLYAGPLNDPEKGFAYAKKARALSPDDASVAVLAGHVAYQSGKYSYAYSLLRTAARSETAGGGLLNDLGYTAYSLGKVEEARQAIERALKAEPTAPRADEWKRFLTFTALEESGSGIAEREGDIQKTLQEKPEDVPALMLKAALHVRRKESDAAIRVYSEVLKRLPEFGLAQKRLAGLYSGLPGRSDAAYEMAVSARKNLPDDPEVAQILAAARYERKEYQSVVQLLQESAAKRPLNAQALFLAGMSRLQIGQVNEGQAALTKAMTLGLDGRAAEEAKKALETKR